MNRIIGIFLFSFIYFGVLAQNAEPYLSLDSLVPLIKKHGYNNLYGKYLGKVEDLENKQDINTIQKQKFNFPNRERGAAIDFIPNQQSVWYKINILPYQGSDKFFWRFNILRFGDVEIFEPQSDKSYHRIFLSPHIPFEANTSLAGVISKPIQTSKQDTLTYFFRAKADYTNHQIMTVTILGYSNQYHLSRYLSKAFLLGILFAMVIYNFLLFFSLKDIAYGWYVGYAFFNFLALLNWYVFDYQYIFPSFVWWNTRGFFVSISFSLVCAIGFSQSFLKINQFLPFVYLLSKIFQVGFFAFAIIFALFPFFEYSTPIYQTILFIPSSLLILVSAIYIHFYHHYKPAAYYVYAFLPLIFLVLIHSIYQQSTGNLLYVGNLTLMELGTTLESILMSLALAFRFNLLKKEAQNVQLENERIIIEKGKELTNTIIQTQEQERKRISQDLHDELGATLSTIKLYISQLQKKPETSQQVSQLLDTAIGQLRSILLNLNPKTLEEEGFTEAMQELAFRITQSGLCEVDFYDLNADKQLNSKQSTALFRISQELINNTLKYAQASQIIIQLIYDGENELIYTYEDNGKGFDTIQNIEKGYGLKNIEARTELLNGKFELDSVPEKGIFVSITFPKNSPET